MIFLEMPGCILHKISPSIKFLCSDCERQNCVHHTLKTAPRYACFNWTSNYAQTIFNLQGASVYNEKIFLLSDQVFKQNFLKTLYILVSRVGDPKQVVIDKKFIQIALRAIFNHTPNVIKNFLEKSNIEIKSNFIF